LQPVETCLLVPLQLGAHRAGQATRKALIARHPLLLVGDALEVLLYDEEVGLLRGWLLDLDLFLLRLFRVFRLHQP
jgi:hypothetical protein